MEWTLQDELDVDMNSEIDRVVVSRPELDFDIDDLPQLELDDDHFITEPNGWFDPQFIFYKYANQPESSFDQDEYEDLVCVDPKQIFEDIDDEPHEVAQNVTVKTEETTDNNEVQPKLSYTYISALALKNSANGLRVTQIYEFMLQHFPYFISAPNRWKNMVRHNLSHNKYFMMETDCDNKRNGRWSIKPAYADEVNAILVRKMTGDRGQEIRQTMSDPENLDRLVRGEMNIGMSSDGKFSREYSISKK